MVTCWDDLIFDRANSRPLPTIKIQPFSGRRRAQYTPSARVERAQALHYHAEVLLVEPDATRLRQYLDYPIGDPVPYFMAADTLSRILRILVPSRDRLHRMVHLAFRADADTPGVLAAIGQLLRRANLNIVTSLLRKELINEASWELVMEADPEFANAHFPQPVPDRLISSAEHLSAVLGVLRDAGPFLPLARQQLAAASVRITTPSYPRSKVTFDEVLFEDDGEALSASVLNREQDVWNGHFTAFVADTQQTGGASDKVDKVEREEDSDHASARAALRLLVVKALEHRQPVLFLSYPGSAKRLAARFKEHPDIRTVFFVDEFQTKNWRLIGPESIARIRQCDLFVGIWHPEEDDRTRLSPWMPFEYGVARAIDLPNCLAYCSSLPEKYSTQRIDPDKAIRSYEFDSFDDEFVRDFAEACISEWTTWINRATDEFRRVPGS